MAKIPTVRLNNGVEMPLEGFGVFQVDDSICERAVSEAIDCGYRLFDTAYSYQNEGAVGAAIKKSGIAREEFFITTKAYIQQMGYEKTMKAVYDSLDALGTGYIDLYLVHMPFGDYYGAWRAMEEMCKNGRMRAIGVSNFLPDRLMDLCYNAEIKPQVNQIELHPHYQREKELALMRELGVQPQAWAPFAEGMKGMFSESVLADIAHKHDKSVPQVILRWDIQRGVAVLPKSIHRERMAENADIWDFILDDEDMRQIGTLDKNTPSMLDTLKPSEVKRLYDYLKNPVLTSLQ